MLPKYKQRSERCASSDSLVAQRGVFFLGHRVAESKVYALDDKVKVMLDYKATTSITELRSCLGLFSYYRRFIKDFAAIAAPLHALTKQERSGQSQRTLKKEAKTTWRRCLDRRTPEGV